MYGPVPSPYVQYVCESFIRLFIHTALSNLIRPGSAQGRWVLEGLGSGKGCSLPLCSIPLD